MSNETDKEAVFLRELTVLSLKHGIVIHGCCDSLFLLALYPERAGGAYAMKGMQLEYRDQQGETLG